MSIFLFILMLCFLFWQHGEEPVERPSFRLHQLDGLDQLCGLCVAAADLAGHGKVRDHRFAHGPQRVEGPRAEQPRLHLLRVRENGRHAMVHVRKVWVRGHRDQCKVW